MQEGKKRKIGRERQKWLALLLVVAMLMMPFENITGGTVFYEKQAQAADARNVPDMTNLSYPFFANESGTEDQSEQLLGSVNNPLQISTPQQLLALAYLTSDNASNSDKKNRNYYLTTETRYATYAESYYILTGNISLEAYCNNNCNWLPIGTKSCPFMGGLDGAGYTISNMRILCNGDYGYSNEGLFGVVQGGTIKNLTLAASSISGIIKTKSSEIGLLVGGDYPSHDGGALAREITIENCHVSNDCYIDLKSNVFDAKTTDRDGLGQVKYCTELVGGLVGGLHRTGGTFAATISNCTNAAPVRCEGIKNVGGIIGGLAFGTVENCTNSAEVSGSRSVGGVIGDSYSQSRVIIRSCTNSENAQVIAKQYTSDYWTAMTAVPDASTALQEYGAGYYVGGITGHNAYMISDCQNRATIEGCSSVGGIVGATSGSVERAWNSGAVRTMTYTKQSVSVSGGTNVTFESTQSEVGGIAGSAETAAKITDSGNTGQVSGKEKVAGILGSWEAVATARGNTIPVQYCYNTGNITANTAALAGSLMVDSDNTKASYYLVSNGSTDNPSGKTENQFASGEVCCLLDTKESGERKNVWTQKLGTDRVPSPLSTNQTEESRKVYKVSFRADFTEETEKYCNEGTTLSALAGYTDTSYTYSYYLVENGGSKEQNGTTKITSDMVISVTRTAGGDGSEQPKPTATAAPTPSVTEEPTATTVPTPLVTDRPDATTAPTSSASDRPDATTAPGVTQAPDSSQIPNVVETPAAQPTKEPDVTQAPSDSPAETTAPTKEPDITQAPSDSPAETTAPTKKPNVTQAPAKAPSAGKKVVSSGVVYKTTGTSSVSVTNVKTKKASVTIPDTVKVNGKKLKVTTISTGAFAGNQKLKKVTMGKNVTTVGKKAFKNCKNLKKISFSAKTKTIGSQSFANCTKLQQVTLPDSVKTIGSKAFYNCKKMKKAKLGKTAKAGALLPEGITGTQKIKAGKLTLKISIGNNAFQNCKSLRSVIINTQVSVIGNSAFKNCAKLSSIIVKSLILKTVGKKALVGVSKCKISVPKKKFQPYRKLFKNKGQGKKVFVAKAS